jgi:putative NIF3 family GTP cyclohydrolase 1 type 2
LVHRQITFAKELKQSVFIGGHRETEKIWPKLLAYNIKKKFGIDVVFLDEKY